MFTIAPTSSPSASPPKAKHAETNKCFFCQKAVFHMEKSEADGMVFHKNCFRCKVCNGKLKQDTYATVNDALYCKSHYDALFQKCGTYNFPDEAVAELTATVRG